MILYRLIQRTVRFAWPRIGTITVLGLDNIPSTGPFLLISNHQSVLDAILIQAYCPRLLHTMAKSTQFAAPVIGPLMTRLYSFPVRRYEIDPQAVRTVLRRLGEGHGVGIYIEGERSWDGKLQAPRLGTVRLILKAGVPVIPATISGSYDAWPRWASGVRPAHVTIAYGRPLIFPKYDDRAAREAALAEAADRIMTALRRQLEDPEVAVAAPTANPADRSHV